MSGSAPPASGVPGGDAAKLVPLPNLIAALDACARIERTRCGGGSLVWRRWGTGRPLVLLHGGAGSWNHWVRNIGTLMRTREVWACDLPALGDSADPPEPGGLEGIVAATADGLATLLPGPRAFDLAGFSFGSLVGTCIAARGPGRVRRMVITGAASLGLPDPRMDLRGWRRARDPAERLALHGHNFRTLMVASAADDPDGVALHAGNVERARFFGGEVAAMPITRDTLGGVDVERVDAIYGALDPVVRRDPDSARTVLQAARPGLRFTTIAGAGHWVNYEAPSAFEAALRAHLED
ncbi:MAG: alpha/beta fold hydrolase [Burkholderiales bacterium]|nr:MAG: alpha/beta fold hydrolase [Burkholderiales bacterium]